MKPQEEIQEKCELVIAAGPGEDNLLARSILIRVNDHGHDHLWCVLALRVLNRIISQSNTTYPIELDSLRSEMQEWIATCDDRMIRCLHQALAEVRRHDSQQQS